MPRRPIALSVLLLVLVTMLASPALAKKGKKDEGPELPPTRQEITAVGFSVNGKEAVFRVIDEHVGTMFQVRSVKKNKIIASFPFEEGGEKGAWRKVSKAHNVDKNFADSPENTKKNVVMMSQVMDSDICIFMMRGEAIKPYMEIPLYKDKRGRTAKAIVKQMVWDGKGKHAVVVYHQETTGRMKWKGDFVHTFKFKSYKVNFGPSEP